MLEKLLQNQTGKSRGARVIALTAEGGAIVDTPKGKRRVRNAAGGSLRAGNSVVITGDDHDIVGVSGMRESPKTVRIRG